MCRRLPVWMYCAAVAAAWAQPPAPEAPITKLKAAQALRLMAAPGVAGPDAGGKAAEVQLRLAGKFAPGSRTEAALRRLRDLSRGASSSSACEAASLALGRETQATITESSCRLSDILPEQGGDYRLGLHRLSLPADAGRRLMEFQAISGLVEPVILVYDAYFKPIVLAEPVPFTPPSAPSSVRSAASAMEARAEVVLEPGDYHVAVFSNKGTLGAYTVLASARSPRECTVQNLPIATSAVGEVSPSGCRLLDLLPGSVLPWPVQAYGLSAGAGLILRSELSASGFPGVLALVDKDGRVAALSEGKPGASSTLEVHLATGKYTLLALSTGGGGSFRLAVEGRTAAGCAYETIAAGSSARGSLSASSCKAIDLLPGQAGSARASLYRFTISAPGALTAEVVSPAFPARILLGIVQKEGRTLYPVAEHNDSVRSPGARLIVYLPYFPAADYILIVMPRDSGAGSYELRTSFQPGEKRAGECRGAELRPGETVGGAFSAFSCQSLDLFRDSGTFQYAKVYSFAPAWSGSLTVETASSDFVPSLVLLDSNQAVVAEALGNPETGVVSLKAHLGPQNLGHAYRLLVMPYHGDPLYVRTGSYEVRSRFEDRTACEVRDITLSRIMAGQLTTADCRLSYVSGSTRDTAPLDIYRFYVPVRGILSAELSGGGFRPAVSVLGKYGSVEPEDRTGSARWTGLLDPGLYTLQVYSADGKTGRYVVRLDLSPPRPCTPEPVPLGRSVDGEWKDGECRTLDLGLAATDAAPVKVYSLIVPAKGQLSVQIAAGSAAEATLVTSAYSSLGPYTGPAPQFNAELKPGAYILRIRSATGKTGTFRLATSFTAYGAATPASCTIRNLALEASVEGSLAQPGCRALDLDSTSASAARMDRYRLRISSKSLLSLSFEGSGFNAEVSLLADLPGLASASVLRSWQASPSGQWEASLTPGSWYLQIRSAGSTGASYRFQSRISALPGRQCPVIDLVPGQAVEGKLTASDCRWLELVPPDSTTDRLQRYRLSLTSPANIEIQFTFTGGWTRAYLYRASDAPAGVPRYLYSNLASGTSTTGGSTLRAALPAGEYFLLYLAPETLLPHSYTVAVKLSASADESCAIVPLGFDQTVKVRMGLAGCEDISYGYLTRPIARFRVEVPARGMLHVIAAGSSYSSPEIELRALGGDQVGREYAASYGLATRFSALLTPGSYEVRLYSYFSYAEVDLAARFDASPPVACSSPPMGLNESRQLPLPAGDCRLMDVTATRAIDYAQKLRINVSAAGALTVDVSSDDFGPLVELYNGTSRITQSSGTGSLGPGRIMASLQPGDYDLVVSAGAFRPGTVTVRTSFREIASLSCPVTDLALNARVSAALEETDCRMLHFHVPSTASILIDRYRVRTQTVGVLTIEVESTAIFPQIGITTDQGTIAAAQTQYGAAGASLTVSLLPGEHQVTINSGYDEVGPYAIRLSFREQASSLCPKLELAPNTAQSGTVKGTECRVLDYAAPSGDTSPVVAYTLNPGQLGLLQVEYSSEELPGSLSLIDNLGRSAGGDDVSPGGFVTRLAAVTDAKRYTLWVKTSGGQGSFTLRTSFRAPNPGACAVRNLALNGSVQAEISASDCRGIDAPTRPAGAQFTHIYALRIPPGGLLDLKAASSVTTPYLTLRDAQGVLVTLGTGSLSATVAPGNYQLLVYLPATYQFANFTTTQVRYPTGAYSLTSSFRPLDPSRCAPAAMEPNGAVGGELAADDCTAAEAWPPGSDSGPVRLYTVAIPQRGVLTMEVASATTYPLLRIHDASGLQAYYSSGSNRKAVLEALLEGGAYTVTVSPGLGRFEMTSAFEALGAPACPAEKLAPGATLTSDLLWPCQEKDFVAGSVSRSRARAFDIQIPRRGVLSLEAEASYGVTLTLRDDKGSAVSLEGAPAAPSTGGSLTASLPAGTWRLVAGAARPQGPFVLRTSFREDAGKPCAAASLALPASVSGSLTAADCRGLDSTAPSLWSGAVDSFRLTVPRRTLLTAGLASSEFDPYLSLRGPSGEWIAVNDDYLGSVASGLEVSLDPGSYTLLAGTRSSELGDYRLTARLADLRACSIGTVAANAPVLGKLDEATCRGLDFMPGTDTRPAAAYQFTLPGAARVTVSAASAEFPAALAIRNARGEFVGWAFDRVKGEVQWQGDLAAGACQVIVLSYNGSPGAFTLRVAH